MDIHLPEMFGWHPMKEEKPETQKTSEPSRFTKWSVMTALIVLVLAMIALTGYYFSEYVTEVFRNLY